MVRMELSRIIIQETTDHQIIVLREEEGGRTFPILIGIYEAMAIDRRVKGIKAPRPLTHDLLNNLVEALGGTLKRIVVNDLQDNTFFARIVVERDGQEIEIDARPSDAVALAALQDTPIYVEESVLDEAAQGPI